MTAPQPPKLSSYAQAALDRARRPAVASTTGHGDGERPPTGAALLSELRAFVARFVALPSQAALTAVTLWLAHTHAIDAAESTPRLALLSPEPASGKTRALEIADLLVPHPMHAVNATPAALFRAVKDLDHRPTILFDEIDTVFGPRAKENEEVRGLLNAGHRRGAVAYRCVGEGTNQKVTAFPAYAALALAGLGDLPDTIMTRSVVVRMRRRAPGEHVEPFRHRVHAAEGHALRDRLAEWTATIAGELTDAYPPLPDGITDRPAEVWEPLLALADAARGPWPQRAREACTELVLAAQTTESGSLGVRLLADLRDTFGQADALPTETILDRLHALEEAPWADLRGKPLDARGLSNRLRPYGVSSRTVRIGDTTPKGYRAEDLHDAWARYLPAASAESPQQPQQDQHRRSAPPSGVADPATVAPHRNTSATEPEPVTSTVAAVADVADSRQRSEGSAACHGCGQPLLITTNGRTRCERCRLTEGSTA